MQIGAREAWRPWSIVALLFAVQTINRADKAVLGLAATAVMAELHLSAERYGLIASSFYTLYAATGLFVGLVFAHRYRPRLILAFLIAAWSLAQLPVIFAASFGALIASRVLLGMGEGNGTPTCINACHEWFPSERRNMPTALVVVGGATFGSIISAPILSLIIEHHGWRAAFGACAIAGACILVLWIVLARDGPYSGISAVNSHGKATTVRTAVALSYLADRTVLGSFVLGLCSEWVVGFMVAWFAPFLSLQLGFSRVRTGWLLSGVFLVLTIVVLGIAAASQMMIRRGASTRVARAILNGICLLVAAPCFAVAAFASHPYLRLTALGLGVGLPQVTFALNPALLSEVFPAEHRNRLLHLLLSGLTIGSLLSPWAAGRLIGSGDSAGWTAALLVNGAVTFIGAVAALVFINPSRSAGRVRSASSASPTSQTPADPVLER